MNRRLFLATGIAVSTCHCSDVLGQTGNFRKAAESINATIRANHYRRTELDSDALWPKGPFSHVSLRKAQESAAERVALER